MTQSVLDQASRMVRKLHWTRPSRCCINQAARTVRNQCRLRAESTRPDAAWILRNLCGFRLRDATTRPSQCWIKHQGRCVSCIRHDPVGVASHSTDGALYRLRADSKRPDAAWILRNLCEFRLRDATTRPVSFGSSIKDDA